VSVREGEERSAQQGAGQSSDQLRRLEAVYRMAETVARATSLDEIFDAALEAIVDGLGVERASILVLDTSGTMRFRAWRGLSDEYRAALDGHSPWTAADPDPQPILVPDVGLEASLAPYRSALEREGIAALAFVPLVHAGELMGKFTFLYPTPHEFAAGELQLAQTVASHIAAATQRGRTQRELVDSRAELQAIFGAVADGITAQDGTGRLVYANEAAAQFLGFASAAEFLAAPIPQLLERFEFFDEKRRPLPVEELPGRIAIREGRSAERTLCYRIRESGEERWSIVRATPVLGEGGEVTLAINSFHDVTDELRSNERVRFLGEASSLLASSLDFEETLARLGDVIVPAVADYCIIDLVEEGAPLRQAVLHHVDPAKEELLREIRRVYPPDGNPQHPASRVLASGKALLIERADEAELSTAARDDHHLDLYHGLEPTSYVVVPLIARGRTLGTLSLGTGESGRRYAADDVVFAEEVASRIALGVENARLYTALQSSYALLDTLLISAPVGIGFWDRDLRFVRVNDALAEINNLPAAEHPGKRLADVKPELAARLEPLYQQVLETGEPVIHNESTDDEAVRIGDSRHWLSSYYPVRTEEGEITGLGAVIMDVTAQRRADDRLRLLAEAGELFASSLDAEDVFARIARVVVPRLADSIHIFLAAGKSLERVACAHVDPELQPLLESLPRSYPLGPGSPAFMASVFERAEPVLFSDVSAEFYEHLQQFGAEREALERIGSRSMMLVPLVARREALGVLAIGSRTPGRYAEADLALAVELAGRAAVAVDNARLFREAVFRTSVLEAQQEASIDGLLLVSPAGELVSYNRRFAELWDFPDELVEQGSDATALAEAMTRVADPESFLERVQYLYEHPEETSREEILLRNGRVLDRYGAAVRGPSGEYLGWLWSFRDVTERGLLERQTRLLSEATTLLGSSLDVDTMLRTLADFLVPQLADWCSIAMLEPNGALRRVAVVHKDPDKAALAEDLRRRFPPLPEDRFGAAEVVRTGEPELYPVISPDFIDAVLETPELGELLSGLGLRSLMSVPIASHGRMLGAISFASSDDSGRRFGDDDLALAQELARRTAIAVDRAELFGSVERSDHRRRFALDAAELGSWELDLRTGQAAQSLLHDRIFGYEEGAPEWSYDLLLEHVHPADREAVDASFAQAIEESNEWDFECRILRRDGEERWIWVRGAIERDGEGTPLSMVGLVRDVTGAKQAETELARRAETSQALEFVGDGVFLLDGEGIVRLWNPAAAAITGLREAEVVGRPLAETLPGWTDVERLIPVAETRHGGGVRAETVPMEIGGLEAWLSISGVAFGEGTVYAFRDLTEERAVDRLKSDFVSTVSHELRTPLAAIYGAAMTLRREDVALTDDQREGMLGVVSGEAERLARIVNDILLASRLDSDVVDVAIGHADARELAEGVVAAAAAHLPPSIELRLTAPDDLAPIAADADKLRQVLVNLLENAIKYSPDGGLVEVTLTSLPGLLRFEVQDHGLGIPAAEQARIFEKFYRLDPHLTRGVGGTGLGLYICREIVRRMGGRIKVESRPGEGSTFSFELPLA
jgi:PAS domain S-box-containing protein